MSLLRHVMFDVDGTLVQSMDFDSACFTAAVRDVLGHDLDTHWEQYTHVTDSGILGQHLRENLPGARHDEIETEVKNAFAGRIAARLERQPARAVAGAVQFFAGLRRRPDISLSIATGGWRDTALMKLASAGIDIDGVPLASGDDHYARTEIMKLARARSGAADELACSYFGDADWDRQACAALGYDFVLVGTATRHTPGIPDFSDAARALACLDL